MKTDIGKGVYESNQVSLNNYYAMNLYGLAFFSHSLNTYYSPSEPVFVGRPHASGEDDGVVLSLVSPLSDDTLTPFIVVLDGRTLAELSRLYLPEYVHVPVGFHSSWVPDAEPDNTRSFYQPRRNHVKPAGL